MFAGSLICSSISFKYVQFVMFFVPHCCQSVFQSFILQSVLASYCFNFCIFSEAFESSGAKDFYLPCLALPFHYPSTPFKEQFIFVTEVNKRKKVSL